MFIHHGWLFLGEKSRNGPKYGCFFLIWKWLSSMDMANSWLYPFGSKPTRLWNEHLAVSAMFTFTFMLGPSRSSRCARGVGSIGSKSKALPASLWPIKASFSGALWTSDPMRSVTSHNIAEIIILGDLPVSLSAYLSSYIHTLHYTTLHYTTLHYITYIHIYIYIYIYGSTYVYMHACMTDRQADTQTRRHADTQTDRQTCRHADMQTYIHMHTFNHTFRHSDT